MLQPAIDSSTRELLHSRIRLRSDLIFIPRRGRWKEWYQLEARHSGRYFRIGLTEYAFISLLDGDTTIGEAVSLTARRFGPDAFSEDQATSIIVWLLENDLAELSESTTTGKQNNNAESGRRKTSLAERLNPFWLKLPFGSPDAVIHGLLPLTSWLHSRAAIFASLALWLAATIALVSNWTRFETSWSIVLHRSNWLWLGAAWLFLKIVHELSHAVACRRHSGEVRDSGIIFILLAPVAYVDVTSSLSFPSKWQRIQVAAAGIYAELTIASLSAIAWTMTDSPLLSHHLVNLMWSASVTTLVFNANPLMKFDGYYILSDLLDRPNLYTDSTQHLQRIASRIFFGVKTDRGGRSLSQDAFLTASYGIAAFVWRMLICIGLLISASVMFHGAGIILATLGVLLWFGRPILQLIQKLWRLTRLDPQKAFRASALGTVCTVALTAFLFLTPWPAGATAPGILDHQNLTVVRAETPGFVYRIHVSDGELVSIGQLLIELKNEELDNEVSDIRVAIEQSDIRRRQLIQNQETAAVQVETENRAALQQRLTKKLQEAESLTVRAPVSGRVMSRSLIHAEGTYARPGTELVAIGDDSNKELRVSISQTDARWLQAAARSSSETTVDVRLRSIGLTRGTVRRILPGATRTPLHESLTAPAGGPLAVKANSDSESQSELMLTEPRVTAIVDVPADVAANIPAGTFGHVWLKTETAPCIAEAVTRIATCWIEDQLNSARRE